MSLVSKTNTTITKRSYHLQNPFDHNVSDAIVLNENKTDRYLFKVVTGYVI